ncbi:MAG: CPBP family intramembrane metalloprotease [Actinobacteria bacterium]|nr:CPBP family intramembrane metalloprotease [Actinomycetota bacterium]
MALAVAAIGFLAAVASWRLVASGRANVWVALGAVMGAAGVAALLTGWVELSPAVGPPVAAAGGLGSGVALWAATVAFVAVASRWEPFRRHAEGIYAQRGDLSLAAALALAVGLVVTGEELFWRGLVQSRLADLPALGRTGGALAAWAGYVAVNAASGSLVLLAGGVVAGAVWGGLALWTGGVLAPLLSHAAWTALMVVVPPPAAGRRPGPGRRAP